MRGKKYILTCTVLVLTTIKLSAQALYEYTGNNAHLLFSDSRIAQYIPHIIRQWQKAHYLHSDLWNLPLDNLSERIQDPVIVLTDLSDNGNGGTGTIPFNLIQIGLAPMNKSYFISPTTELYCHLFEHEYTHMVMADRPAKSDKKWRHFFGGKFSTESDHPFSALWSYLSSPRWYAPRWYHEGIACFAETWMGGGAGRALGAYDEMYFRSLVNEGKQLYSVVGLETEGTVSDFQLGVNSYLYGTRFINYLVLSHGLDSLKRFYNRTDDSRVMFNRQFESVYGKSLRQEWDNWIEQELKHQREQLSRIKEYPLTPIDSLTDHSLGSVSPPLYDSSHNKLYYAANYPGELAHLEEFDLTTGKRKKLHNIDGPMLFQTSYVALDTLRQRLIYTTQNDQLRGLSVFDLKKRRITKQLDYQRVAEIVYDNNRDCLYGIRQNRGICYLVRYDSNIDKLTVLYPFGFGVSVSDLAVSHDGKHLTVAISENSGGQNLIMFNVDQLEKADLAYEKLLSLEGLNLSQFRFAPGDTILIGSSYYTGVSNIWQLNLRTRQFDLLSNTDVGLFSPVCYNADSLIALKFTCDGMLPVRMLRCILHDANTISLLGQQAYEQHREDLESIGIHATPVPEIAFNDVFDSINVYHPLHRMRFCGFFPEISGFTDPQSWNNMTPVLGARFKFSDLLAINTLSMSLGVSPWSNNDVKNRFHADLQWKFNRWTLTAAWNGTDFYDLFGPIQSSRKGWQIVGGYENKFKIKAPYVKTYGFNIGAYGDMDALPLFQNVKVDENINAFEVTRAYWRIEKGQRSLGAIMPEQGWSFSANAYSYLAGGKLFPLLDIEGSAGWLLPWRNSSFWIRTYAGQSFGNQNSVFGNNYFGGFRNNYIDYRNALRYREVSSMPGAEIDEISAHNYYKCQLEFNMRPLHFNNIGLLNFYPTAAYASFFSSVLLTNLFKLPLYANGDGIPDCSTYANIGTQLNIDLVFFKHMKTTLSAGYARIFMPDGTNKWQWMCSLKLL